MNVVSSLEMELLKKYFSRRLSASVTAHDSCHIINSKVQLSRASNRYFLLNATIWESNWFLVLEEPIRRREARIIHELFSTLGVRWILLKTRHVVGNWNFPEK